MICSTYICLYIIRYFIIRQYLQTCVSSFFSRPNLLLGSVKSVFVKVEINISNTLVFDTEYLIHCKNVFFISYLFSWSVFSYIKDIVRREITQTNNSIYPVCIEIKDVNIRICLIIMIKNPHHKSI